MFATYRACPVTAGETGAGLAARLGTLRAGRPPTDYDSFTPDSPLVPVARFITLCHREIRSKPMARGRDSCRETLLQVAARNIGQLTDI